ncbi:putative alpha/beta hydrolase [Delitschia confertaspora ATCC 74209]|uniref:Alpha/beta hydrolase n=1 Tax=Delitschia confertaspora ATCC 74209 TaxID=1513339 RepID=A0A9P4JAN1_9PLEO|nr:putative alpha/beta hydrolase [Delitschia confertaspora ATCC 74209]
MPFLPLGYKKIHYTDYPPSASQHSQRPRETFIFIHGLGSTQNYYHAIATQLQAQNFRCITFDTTGAGRSPYTQIEQSIESLSEDVMALMDALPVSPDVEKAIVVGHSMGGIIAAHLAATRSDRIVAAILIGPVYPSSKLIPVFEKRIPLVEKEGMDAMANTIPSAATAEGTSPLIKGFIRELLLAQDPAGYCSNCRVIINAKKPDYGKIAIPVLIVAGDEDKSAPVEDCERIYDEIGTGDKRMKTMRNVGHWHCVEKPEEVGKLILDFIQEIQ